MEALRKLRVIKTDAEYKEALGALQEFLTLDPDPGTEEAEVLQLLSLVVHDYESKHFSFLPPDPVEAIKFRMEQQGLTQRDLTPYIGSRSKVSEVLCRKRPLTLSMIRALHEGLGIPAEALLPRTTAPADEELKIDWSRFPLGDMIKRHWIVADTSVDRNEGARATGTIFFSAEGKICSRVFVSQIRTHSFWPWNGQICTNCVDKLGCLHEPSKVPHAQHIESAQ